MVQKHLALNKNIQTMKNIFFIISLFTIISCKAQTYPLRTYGIEYPTNSYIKDTNNELPSYEGIWKGVWNNKTIYVTLKKIKRNFTHLENKPYYMDILIGKFKVTDTNGLILFDNTNTSDDEAKIEGGKFRKSDDNYSLTYADSEMCNMNGFIKINFTDTTKTKLNWQFSDMTDIITPDCPYYNANPFPEPLPKNTILIKQ
ncbi:hypothetical protein QFZ37_002180 [Chryseobacterium ginsenosidimutans]|uniref:DUF6705 family protein n=1 Tax=Chryseobacterium ginsenosidimutans TaxID=687846 RepID=UPI00277E9E0A|nr:DUF6705 family protein [Chryseobacterium ginsenosidimutans]MDQ0593811.1 hypothetical protein [Chryseobacterium ginsenosidimutans]